MGTKGREPRSGRMRRLGERKASGRGSASLLPSPAPAPSAAPRSRPSIAAPSLQQEGRARPASSPASPLRRGDTRQKAAGRRRGRARPGTPTRTPPAVGAERRATTSGPAWPRRPALLPPRLSGPRCLPAPRAAEGANAGGRALPACLPSPRPYKAPPRVHRQPCLPALRPDPTVGPRRGYAAKPGPVPGQLGHRCPRLRRHQVGSARTWRQGAWARFGSCGGWSAG